MPLKNLFIKNIKDCKNIIAGDRTILKEILNPLKDNLEIRYSLAYAVVKPGKVTLLHKLKVSEVYYILQGKGIIEIDTQKQKVESGEAVYIPSNSTQKISNIGKQDLIFLCIVDPAWRKENEKILED